VRVDGHRLRRRVPHVGGVLHERVHEREQVLDLATILELLDAELVVFGLEALALVTLLPKVHVRVAKRLL
jgi:hypothetical protein